MPTAQTSVPTLALADITSVGEALPMLHHVRDTAPIAWLPELGGYLFTRRADVVALLKDRRLATGNTTKSFATLSQEQVAQLLPLIECITKWMGHTTPDGHLRFQLLLKRYFTPAAMEKLRPRARQITEELLDAVADAGRMEVVQDLAIPLPASIIAEMLGMPVADRHLLRVWSGSISAVFGRSSFEELLDAQRGIGEFQDYLRVLVEQRRSELGEDLISELIRAEAEGQISTEEIVANCVLLLFAGHETTAGVITHGLRLLLDHPDQLALLRDNPELGRSAVEEILRYDGIAHTVVRTVTEPLEVDGHQFEAGEQFYLSLYAANHDPANLDDPDRFDIARQRNVHVAFGAGMFYCLGASLARVETSECLKVVLERFPHVHPDGDPTFSVVQPLGHRTERLPVAY
jgi:cytochrome P450